MNRLRWGIPILVLSLSVAAAQEVTKDKPADQFQALVKEFQKAAQDFYSRAKTDEERNKMLDRVDRFPARFLELAEKYPNDAIALDALVEAINLELSIENNSLHPGFGKNSPQARAIAILLRDHIKSDKLGHACWRVSYGFHKECETLLRTVLEKSPHREVQGAACLRLAQFLNARSNRLDLLKERPEMAKRYQGLYGKAYVEAILRQDRAKVDKEVESLFERAVKDFSDVKLPYDGKVGEQAKSELFELRFLTVGKEAQEIEGPDQDLKRFKLSDYRGKVVLLYFWSEY